MSNIPVFLASDNNYAAFVASTIASICDNTNSYVDFYILDDKISQENKNKIEKLKDKFDNFSIEFLAIDTEKEFKGFVETDRITKSMYSRYLIPVLKPELNKALYSDVDVIALDDIAKMYNQDLGGYALGAVWEEFAEKTANIERKSRLELSDSHKYFCSGHLLIDCKQWRDDNVLEKLIKLVIENIDILDCPDQDILNKFYDSNYKTLSSDYSFLNQNFYFYEDISNIVIRHFNGKIKPWHISPDIETSLIPNHQDFWKYLKMTAFYDEIYSKTQDKAQQQQILRHLKIANMMRSKDEIRK